MKQLFRHIIPLLLLASCAKEIDNDIQYQANDALVIQAILTSDTSYQEVHISELWDQGDFDVISGRSGAEVYIITDVYNLALTEIIREDTTTFIEVPGNPGIYATDSFQFEYIPYRLVVIYEGDTIRAVDTAKAFNKTEGELGYIDTIATAIPSNPNFQADYYRLANTDYYTGAPVLYKVILNWSEVEGFENLPKDSTTAEVIGYKFKTLEANQLFGATAIAEEVLFPKNGTEYTIESFSLSKPHQDYLRGIASETRWKGGLFDLETGNPIGNLSGGAFGFFGVSEKITIKGTTK